MKFDTPAGQNPIDRLKVVGQPLDRIDGPLKTSGRAPYAYERHDVVPNQAYGWIVGSAIAKGRIKSIDLADAKAAPGVIGVVTAADAGTLGKSKRNAARLLGGPEIQHYHQAVAIVVAETFEQARHAAKLVRVNYTRADGKYDLAAVAASGTMPKEEPDKSHGDFAAAFAASPVKFDARYETPDQSHAMMEPHASIAAWEGQKLTIWTSHQMIDWATSDTAETLGIPKADVRIVSPYIGGGFGGKLFTRSDAILAALAARATGRPVKIALARPQIFNNTTHRPATRQRIRIGAGRDGKITAIGHESWSGNLPGGDPETATAQTQLLYAGANRMTKLRLAVLDLPEGNAMRAPGEAPGMMALEIAMDEMAETLGMDPVQFRIINDTQVDPMKPERPFSQRQLVKCLEDGAAKFGWDQRRKPGTRRDGDWLVGMGVASAFRNNMVQSSGARVRLEKDGSITVETDMTDIGTGSYTIIAQTAAEMMGVPIDKVQVRLGDSAFPVSAGSGGQWGGNSATAGVYAACVKLREAVAQKLGFNSADADFTDGRVSVGRRSAPLRDAGELVAEDTIEFDKLSEAYQQSTFGGHFVEVGVHAMTGEVRVRRMLAVCAAGRILNPKSARSQVIGAMTMGVGAALMEELAVDKRFGFFVNHDLAAYEVPVHADIPHQEVVFLDEVDPISSPMKAKGVGELGISGVAAAIANAIYNATGVRVRDYPITLEKHLDTLPSMA
ncbi:aldehyde oxidoreductase molybdenum-binding subunit PaoC [Polymorphobacter fuscus]|uniref:Molybdopterin-dependent oxidoreductase n=1 Tax=Sandarakinorhabdus fusca TaxID=1439888 RepID=A0A7C9LI40_9SPHN|nr:aldehyde oxidoreductase molybdenum-binding subunit PaoC [Polymorphobacter fuscus]KAB7643722.1 xanthine dehydrogenase family protein molybdopterin-binding subunit [Polymorphobacter fuscus]MQT18667.1 molybdopterin-dependent oxidoreductase [Polymorphobacter fuscus]NJC08116.1 xanthine dehydrogenase YagR molybdenum-binding subunit [Polymorphobacter fuscus]